MSITIAKQIKIQLPADWIRPLADEFKTTKMNVYNSLRYQNNSDTAIAIRKRAKEMLEEAASLIND